MKRKLIWIGTGCWFPDSLVWFKEHDINVTVVRVKAEVPWFKTNYAVFDSLGFKILNNGSQEIQTVCESLDEETLVIGGGYFGGDIPSLFPTRTADLEEIEVLYQISKYNQEHACGAVCLRCHNGDTGFGSQRMVDLYNEKIRYVDILMFDNDLLRDFVLSNSQVAREKKTLIGYMETPLKRFVVHNTNMIERRMISLGRCFSQFDQIRRNILKLPITFYPLPPRPAGVRGLFYNLCHRNSAPCVYQLAGRTEDLNRILVDRKLFMKWEGCCAFGMSHMYDIFYHSIEYFHDYKEHWWSLAGQRSANGAQSPAEQYYAFVNNPSKDVCYMMYGIVPLISHTENSYYKGLIERKMAILIKTRDDLKNVLQLSDVQIQEYRDNIWQNRDLFTFDHVAETILTLPH